MGPNPFDYLAASYNQDGTRISFLEWNGSQWQGYADLEGYTLATQRPQAQWGKSPRLSEFYNVYDWVAESGYDNFVNWVE